MPFWILAVLSIWVFAATPAHARGDAHAAKGIVAEHCAGCHAVPGIRKSGLPTLEAPSFQAIADDRVAYPRERLRAFLQKPHFPMRSLILSPSDIENLLAYIEGLRRDETQ